MESLLFILIGFMLFWNLPTILEAAFVLVFIFGLLALLGACRKRG